MKFFPQAGVAPGASGTHKVILDVVSIPLTASSLGLVFSLLASILTDFLSLLDRLFLVSALTRL